MIKKFIFLFPYIFTESDFYRYEIDKLNKSKNFKVEVHELSPILNKKNFNDLWQKKNKVFKNHIKFKDLNEWKNYLKKQKDKFIIYSQISLTNFKSLFVYMIIKNLKCDLIVSVSEDVATFKDRSNIFQKIILRKPNLHQIFFHLIRSFIILIVKFLKFEKVINLYINKSYKKFNSKKNLYIKIFSDDASKCLIDKSKIIKPKNMVTYLDTPGPYYGDDYVESGKSNNLSKKDINEYYNQLKHLFFQIKRKFNLDVIVIPHPKNKGKINPHLKNFKTDHRINAAQTNIKKSKLVISKGSTAIAYAVYYKKPAILIYSNILKDFRLKYDLKAQSQSTGSKVINISNNLNLLSKKIFKVNKKKYENYKSIYMISNKNKKNNPNYQIIRNLINKL